jgi:hypothetical protein
MNSNEFLNKKYLKCINKAKSWAGNKYTSVTSTTDNLSLFYVLTEYLINMNKNCSGMITSFILMLTISVKSALSRIFIIVHLECSDLIIRLEKF